MRTVLRVFTVWVILTLPFLYSSCGDGGGTGPDPGPVETLASFQLTVPDSISEGEAFPLSIRAVGNRGTTPLTSYSGTVNLSTTLGTVTPSSLSVSNGTGSAQVTLSSPGQQTLTASGSGRTGSAGVSVTDLPDPPVEGNPQAVLEEVVQDSVFHPLPTDYSDDHPELGGLYLSHNTILLVFGVGTTVKQANDLLLALGAELVGSIPGIPGENPSLLIVKLPTTIHQEMEAALGTLRASPLVVEAVQDVLLGPHATPPSGGTHPISWTWSISGPGGTTENLKLVRAPQMWNLNGALRKAHRGTLTGILDVGFGNHPDVSFATLGTASVGFHGLAVAGIIAAKYGNDLGIEGINPFSDSDYSSGGLVVSSLPLLTGGGSGTQLMESVGALMVSGLRGLRLARPALRLINISLGYNWGENGVDPNTSAARALVTRHGSAVAQMLQGSGAAPLIVVSAGNDNGLDARYGSPFTSAALEHGVGNILVVENGFWDGTDLAHFSQSNVGGHIMAPGLAVLTTTSEGSGYEDHTGLESHTGTSYAAAYVSGLAGYMLAADPNLGPAEIKLILFNNGTHSGLGGTRGIDAWASAMGIDGYRGNEAILRMMVDIDDGTPDGNQRVDYEDPPLFGDFLEDDADGDGGIGDGSVDMSDFRTWRDWYLRLNKAGEEKLDGGEDHVKMDVNGNGEAEDPQMESVFPRGDFNGDGLLDLTSVSFVPGAVNGLATDLQVLQQVFDDPDYSPEELDTLVLSVDLEVDGSAVFERLHVPSVTVEIREATNPPASSAILQSRVILPAAPRQVFTVRRYPGGFRTSMEAGAFVFDFDDDPMGWTLGEEMVARPLYAAEIPPKATFLSTCEDPGAVDAVPILLSDWGIEPGDVILINGEGRYFRGDIYDDRLEGVFSKSSELTKELVDLPGDSVGAPPKKLVRRTVTGAIDAGNDVWTPRTYSCPDQVTDIPQDFSITPHTQVVVPPDATHLFLAALDSRYEDNEPDSADRPRVTIMALYGSEWTARYRTTSGGR